jgi:hypothetical protein
VVETGGLENRFTFAGNGGSNPSPSATYSFRTTSFSKEHSVAALELSERKDHRVSLWNELSGETPQASRLNASRSSIM